MNGLDTVPFSSVSILGDCMKHDWDPSGVYHPHYPGNIEQNHRSCNSIDIGYSFSHLTISTPITITSFTATMGNERCRCVHRFSDLERYYGAHSDTGRTAFVFVTGFFSSDTHEKME